MDDLMNLFVYGNTSHVYAIGWSFYRRSGSYEEQVAYLRERANHDYRNANRQEFEEPITRQEFEVMNRVNPFTNTLMSSAGLSEDTVYCVTHIVNGKPAVDEAVDELNNPIPDYLIVYLEHGMFDFPRLIQDDYFEAIHLLWNKKKYISCLKLVFSAIDTWGYIDSGSSDRDSFLNWLDTYCELDKIGILSNELWELRNSLIHMTNLDSHKVRKGKFDRLLPNFSHPDISLPSYIDGMKVFHVTRFVKEILPRGLEHWFSTYNKNTSKFPYFVERYDRIVSEARLSVTTIENAT